MLKKYRNLFLVLVLVSLVSAGCIKQGSPEHADTNNAIITGADQSTNQTNAKTYTAAAIEGKTALEALKATYRVETKQFPGLGDFVQTIDGVTPDSSHYWAFYINGQSSNVGASQYVAKKGDTFEFRLEEIKEQ